MVHSPTSTPWDDAAPLLPPRYEITRRLAAGTLGTVWLVRDRSLEQDVALKVIHGGRLDAVGLEVLQQEFRAFASLRHPQIATAYDFGYTADKRLPFYTREYVEGAPLAAGPPGDAIARAAGGTTAADASDPETFLSPLFDLLDALEYLHGQGILHRDIHAGNVIVGHGDRGAVLIDFGLQLSGGAARPHAYTPSSRHRNSDVDTAQFLPPELIAGEPATTSSDIWSVGRLLLWRLAGPSERAVQLPREVHGWSPRLNLELERIVTKALQPMPQARFATAAAFAGALAAALGRCTKKRRGEPSEPRERTLGRDAELARVEQCLEAACRGEVARLAFLGEFGVGKSRLLDEARVRAQIGGLDVVSMRFVKASASEPGLRGALRRTPGIGEQDREWLQALAVESGGSSRQRAQCAVSSFFQERDLAPLVLVLDDVHAADHESRLLIEAFLSASDARTGTAGPSSRGLALLLASDQPTAPVLFDPLGDDEICRLEALDPTTIRLLAGDWLSPIDRSSRVEDLIVDAVRGNPLRLRRLVLRLLSEHRARGRVPDDADVSTRLPELSRSLDGIEAGSKLDHDLLLAMATLGRPAETALLAAMTRSSASSVRARLGRLSERELLQRTAEGKTNLFSLADPTVLELLIRRVTRAQRREIHLVAANWYAERSRPTPRQLASLAHHRLECGERGAGEEAALRAASVLRETGLHDEAARLLRDAIAGHSGDSERVWTLAESISEVRAAAGDHAEAIEELTPLFEAARDDLHGSAAVRWRRRMGVHFHRAGQAEQAAELFDEAVRLADPVRDREDLVFIRGELAELHTLRGEYDEADASCRAGLALLSSSTDRDSSTLRHLEVTLRASLGHLELRRLRLDEARRELESARDLCGAEQRRDRALILNNLAIVYSQMDELRRAEDAFGKAESLFRESGDRGAVLLATSNRAIIAAKLGRHDEAMRRLEEAEGLSRGEAGDRVELWAVLTRPLVDHHFGRMAAAAKCFPRAIELANQLGDEYMASFSQVYLGDARQACGEYREARRLFEQIVRRAQKAGGPTILLRMALSRLIRLEATLGQTRLVDKHRHQLDELPRTHTGLAELRNDLSLASVADGVYDARRTELERLCSAFESLGVRNGARSARVELASCHLRAGRISRAQSIASQFDCGRSVDDGHALLAVLEPLVLAEIEHASGQPRATAHYLNVAASAIVGETFLDLDLRIEALSARVAHDSGDTDRARHHLHRALQTRELIARPLSPAVRTAYLQSEDLRALDDLAVVWTAQSTHSVTRDASTLIASAPHRPQQASRASASTPRAFGAFRAVGLVTASEPMRQVATRCARFQDFERPVLIHGETGTGKELIAAAIHRMSPRRDRPFVALHCASVPADLCDAELFGYARGAFTGAEEDHAGLFTRVRGGTLFLDEVASLPSSVQAKIVHAIDTGTVRPLGSLDGVRVDVRLLASSSVNPEDALDARSLRRELYERLRAFDVEVPPLRARPGDAALLLQHFLARYAREDGCPVPSVSKACLSILEGHEWPGNVRELQTVAIRLLVGSQRRDSVIGPAELRTALGEPVVAGVFQAVSFEGRDLGELHRELDRAFLTRLFQETGGDVRSMCKELGVKRSGLYLRFQQAGLDVAELRKRL